jgi:DNA modification methylase
MTVRIVRADVLAGLAELPDDSVHCVVTSPPYWGLRDYGVAGQIGLEATPDAFVARMVEVFRDVRRVLRKDGTLWLNLGDSYAGGHETGRRDSQQERSINGRAVTMKPAEIAQVAKRSGLKPKDLIGIPWRVAFALQADGWWLRSDIIWSKPNPMPESVTDRPTKAHEYLFLLTKAERYWYDDEAIKEVALQPLGAAALTGQHKADAGGFTTNGTSTSTLGSNQGQATRNKRSVWTIATAPFPEAHFATFPPALPETCIKAGCPVGGTVLDPFAGAGTTLLVADRLQRHGIGIELNPEYADMAERRVRNDGPLFADIA